MSSAPQPLEIDARRFEEILECLERMAAGDLTPALPLSPAHDALDALAHGINVLVGELRWTQEQSARAHAIRNAELLAERSAAEQASHAKSDALRSLSHELRTPLSSILMASDLIQGTHLDPDKLARFVERIRANSQALLGLVQGMLDLAAIEAGRVALEPQAFDVTALAEDVVRGLEPQALAKNLELTVHSTISALVTSDPRYVRQILLNLLANATKFTEAGEVRLTLSLENGCLVAEIADTGIGISPDDRQGLFQPFGQARSSTRKRYGGSGLGLAVAQGVTQQLGGRLALVESRPVRAAPSGSRSRPNRRRRFSHARPRPLCAWARTPRRSPDTGCSWPRIPRISPIRCARCSPSSARRPRTCPMAPPRSSEGLTSASTSCSWTSACPRWTDSRRPGSCGGAAARRPSWR
jgi:signal transduction histidine kinase